MVASVHGILQARILEWVAIPSPGGLSDPGVKPRFPTLQADSLLIEPPGKCMTKKHLWILAIFVFILQLEDIKYLLGKRLLGLKSP